MGIGSDKKRHTETAVDDRPTGTPHGGFAPIDGVVVEPDLDVAAMPPPPPSLPDVTGETTGGRPAHVDPDEGTAETDDPPGHALVEEAADFSPPTAAASLADEPAAKASDFSGTPDPARGTAPFPAIDETSTGEDSIREDPGADDPVRDGTPPDDPEPDRAAGRARRGGDSVIFFGDGAGSTTPSSWIPDEDADLIMPIEPARIVTAPTVVNDSVPAPVSYERPSIRVTTREQPTGSDGQAGTPPMTTEAAVDLVVTRFMRGISRLEPRLLAFLTDAEATHVTLTPCDGSILLLAGSELAGFVTVLPDDPPGFAGASLELSPPENASDGVRLPICLVTPIAGSREVGSAELGDITISVVEGLVEFAAALAGRVERSVIDQLSARLLSLEAAANQAFEDQGRSFEEITVDTYGSIRLESGRS